MSRKNIPGPDSQLTATRRRKLLSVARGRPNLRRAAAAAGVPYGTLLSWLHRYPAFRLEYYQAVEEYRQIAIDAAADNARLGKGSAINTIINLPDAEDYMDAERRLRAKTKADMILDSIDEASWGSYLDAKAKADSSAMMVDASNSDTSKPASTVQSTPQHPLNGPSVKRAWGIANDSKHFKG